MLAKRRRDKERRASTTVGKQQDYSQFRINEIPTGSRETRILKGRCPLYFGLQKHSPLIGSIQERYSVVSTFPRGKSLFANCDYSKRFPTTQETISVDHPSLQHYPRPSPHPSPNIKQPYYDSLAKADAQGESTAFIEFMLEMVQKALQKMLNDEQINPRLSALLALIARNPRITYAKAAEALEVSYATARRDFSQLRNNGLIAREGSDKIGTWRIVDTTNS